MHGPMVHCLDVWRRHLGIFYPKITIIIVVAKKRGFGNNSLLIPVFYLFIFHSVAWLVPHQGLSSPPRNNWIFIKWYEKIASPEFILLEIVCQLMRVSANWSKVKNQTNNEDFLNQHDLRFGSRYVKQSLKSETKIWT